MKPQEMWAVVDPDVAYGVEVLAVERTKRGAKNTALAMCEPTAKWAYAKEYLGWRVRPCTVIVHDEEGEG